MKRIALLSCSLGLAVAFAGLVQGQEKTQVPDEIVKELQFLVGKWSFEGRVGDGKVSGTITARWAQGRYCLITQDSIDVAEGDAESIGRNRAAGVIGWEPKNERITHGGFSSDGNAFLNWWKVTESGDWEGETSGTMEGQEGPSAFKITKHGKDKFVFESTTPEGQEIEVAYTKTPWQGKRGNRKKKQ